MPKKKRNDDHIMSVRLPAEWYEILRVRAFEQRAYIGDLIREAVRAHFDLPPAPE